MMKPDEFPILPECLQIFAPTNLKAKYNEAKFRDLSEFSFTGEQKNFFVRQNDVEIAKGDVIDIRFGCSGRSLENRYNLPHTRVAWWSKNWKVGPNVNQDGSSGRKPSVDLQGMLDYHSMLKEGKMVKIGKKTYQAHFIHPEETAALNKQYRFTLKRRGHLIDSEDEELVLNPKTVKKLKKVSEVLVIVVLIYSF